MGRLAYLFALAVLIAMPASAKTAAKSESGIASFYATKFVGHRTASGELLDRERFTAAHRNLPFGTKLEVTNKRNGRKIVVTVNDRGPHKKGRIIDLSPAAASQLGITRAGLAQVEIRVAELR
ncbi:MAG TPA: septal ring lytic transglycosylase RlpA family protein [Stellaceae bacterium]|nr:septal ring lytic transglycosylase RlpA family protein [Stellaceae bacterium]